MKILKKLSYYLLNKNLDKFFCFQYARALNFYLYNATYMAVSLVDHVRIKEEKCNIISISYMEKENKVEDVTLKHPRINCETTLF